MLTNRIDFWLILILKSSDISSNIKIIQNYFNLKLILNFEIKNLKIYLKLIMNFKSIFQRKPRMLWPNKIITLETSMFDGVCRIAFKPADGKFNN